MRRSRIIVLVIALAAGGLAAMLASVTGSCCTHENPPLVSWTPEPEEIDFHLRRFRRLAAGKG